MASFDDLLNNAPAEKQGAPQLSKEEYAAKKKIERDTAENISSRMSRQLEAQQKAAKTQDAR